MELFTEKDYKICLELGKAMHPHLGMNNHTNELITKLYKREPLTGKEYFDLGKYYARMCRLPNVTNEQDQTRAIIAMKQFAYVHAKKQSL